MAAKIVAGLMVAELADAWHLSIRHHASLRTRPWWWSSWKSSEVISRGKASTFRDALRAALRATERNRRK